MSANMNKAFWEFSFNSFNLFSLSDNLFYATSICVYSNEGCPSWYVLKSSIYLNLSAFNYSILFSLITFVFLKSFALSMKPSNPSISFGLVMAVTAVIFKNYFSNHLFLSLTRAFVTWSLWIHFLYTICLCLSLLIIFSGPSIPCNIYYLWSSTSATLISSYRFLSSTFVTLWRV